MKRKHSVSTRRKRRKRVLAEHIPITMARQTRRKCAFADCRKLFHPKRYWMIFCSRKCRRAQWAATHFIPEDQQLPKKVKHLRSR